MILDFEITRLDPHNHIVHLLYSTIYSIEREEEIELILILKSSFKTFTLVKCGCSINSDSKNPHNNILSLLLSLCGPVLQGFFLNAPKGKFAASG